MPASTTKQTQVGLAPAELAAIAQFTHTLDAATDALGQELNLSPELTASLEIDGQKILLDRVDGVILTRVGAE